MVFLEVFHDGLPVGVQRLLTTSILPPGIQVSLGRSHPQFFVDVAEAV